MQNVIVAKMISVKQPQMLLQEGMNIVTQVKIQSQQNILINFLNTDLIGKFSEEFQIK